MSIIKNQEPKNIHSVFIPVNYVWKTDISYTENFRYKYLLENSDDGEFFHGNTVPLKDSLSYNTPNEILKSKTFFNFSPSVKSIWNIKDNTIVYGETVSEDINLGDSSKFSIKSAFRYSALDFNPIEHLINKDDSKDFLVNMPNEHNIRLIDDFTFRTYNGFIDSLDSSLGGLFYQGGIKMFTTGGSASAILFTTSTNPYYQAQSSHTDNPTVNGDNFVIEIPGGINNFQGATLILKGYWDTHGDWHGVQRKVSFEVDETGWYSIKTIDSNIISGTITHYDYWAYKYPCGSFPEYRISKKHRFNIVQDCKFEAVNVGWENTKGGVDYYVFTKANEKKISIKKDIYEQNLYEIDHRYSGIVKNKFNKGMNVYRNTVFTIYEVNTDWLSQDEINGLEDLFRSTEVYMYINGEWQFVISVEKKATIFNKKRKGLKKYKLNFQISEKNVRY